MKLYITIGVSGSGKTTWAEKHILENPNTIIICRDDYRKSVLAYKKSQGRNDFKWKDWKWKWEPEVDKLRDLDVEYALEKGCDVILADTNLSVSNYENVRRIFVKNGYDVEFKYFSITWDEAISRNAERINGVSYSVLATQFEKWNRLFPEFKVFENSGTEDAVIVDVDGTVARMVERGPFEWDRVDEDKPIQHVVDLIRCLHKAGKTIIFLSGRDGSCKQKTNNWLAELFDFQYYLFMRVEGDQRKDSIVKRELLDMVPRKFRIQMVIDDRPQVCRMWRQIGLNVLQVADPYKEF